METHTDILPVAFHILWHAAQIDRQNEERHSQTQDRRNRFKETKPRSLDTAYEQVMQDKLEKEVNKERYHSMGLLISEKMTSSVVVMDCEDGEKVVKKYFQDARDSHGQSRTEDSVVDWLTSDLTARQSSKVEVTIYLSCPPQSTTSDGLLLWWKKLLDEGKTVSLTVKLSGLGCLSPWFTSQENEAQRERNLVEESQEIVQGLVRLRGQGAVVGTISPKEWPTIMSLLTDRGALASLHQSHTAGSGYLAKLLD